jgi:hypothetical protein
MVLNTRWGGAAAIVMTLLLPSIVACTDSTDEVTVPLGKHGGRVGPGGTLGELDMPSGVVDGETTVTFRTGAPTTTATLTDLALPVGNPVAILPVGILGPAGAHVRLAFDPATDLPTVDGRRATLANAFIAVFSEELDVWIPLPTTYDAVTGQLVTKPPHYSWFSRQVVNPAKSFWSPNLTGVEAAEMVIAAKPGRTVPYKDLSTRCGGIHEAKFEGRYYVAVRPLSSDRNGNPPDGWVNGRVAGTMRVISPTEIVFRDKLRHIVLFRLRPGAIRYKVMCRGQNVAIGLTGLPDVPAKRTGATARWKSHWPSPAAVVAHTSRSQLSSSHRPIATRLTA